MLCNFDFQLGIIELSNILTFSNFNFLSQLLQSLMKKLQKNESYCDFNDLMNFK